MLVQKCLRATGTHADPTVLQVLDMGTCQNDWLVTGPLAHTRYIPRYIGYVTEGGCRDIPKVFCPAEDMKAARQGVCNRLAFQGVCNRGLVARNATTPFSAHPHMSISAVTGAFFSKSLLVAGGTVNINSTCAGARGGGRSRCYRMLLSVDLCAFLCNCTPLALCV